MPSLEVAVDEKEKELQKALLECDCTQRLLELVMSKNG